jgi:hypothetical protein
VVHGSFADVVTQEQMMAQVETWWFRRTCVGSRSIRLDVSDCETKDIPKNKLISVLTLDYFMPLN